MQFRVWMRQSQGTGILVSNTFTTEPNKPYLPVIFYYAVGKMSRWIGCPPEFVYAYAGSIVAFGFTILLFCTVRHFLKLPYQVWWVFLAILIGGGLGAHLKILANCAVVRNNFLLNRIIVEGLWSAGRLFEDYRNHYIFIALSDTHGIFVYIITIASVVSLYFTLARFSLWRVILTAFLYWAVTFLHVYEGITLIMITGGVAFLCWRKKLVVLPAITTLTVCAFSVVTCFIWLIFLHRSSGLPVPHWRAPNILFSVLLIAYPLAWVLIAWGIRDYWGRAGLNECFLLGWALGCTTLTLSGPFYPYPDRGTLTLQIPIYIIAGVVYFSRYERVKPLAALLAILLLGATPAWVLKNQWKWTSFNRNAPYTFMSPEHREIVGLLREKASKSDVLVVDKSDVDWEADDLWLAPEYPGRLYCGHFFLTVDYKEKREKVIRFFEKTPEEQAAFLRQEKIRFLYVNAKKDPQRFELVPGLVLLKALSIGSLFEYND